MTLKDQVKHGVDFLCALPASVKTLLDSVSIASIIATFASWLPSAAALLSVIWTGIRIYETRTVQRLLGKDRRHRVDDVTEELERANDER